MEYLIEFLWLYVGSVQTKKNFSTTHIAFLPNMSTSFPPKISS